MPFENQLELNIRAFFFNAKTDYLPYYKNFSFVVNPEIRLKEILVMIKEQNSDFSYPDMDLLFRVNDFVVTGDKKISLIVDKLGKDLTIDPALKFRSDNGLILNNHDFMHQFRRTVGHYATKEDLAYYITLYPVHYASETFNYAHQYIGDAVLILAYKLIMDGNEHKDKILDAINNDFCGISCCEYENNVFEGEDYNEQIDYLKKELRLRHKKSLIEMAKGACLKKIRKEVTIDSLEGKKIALYIGNRDSDTIATEGRKEIESVGKFISFDMSTKLAGQTILDINPTMTYQKAGKMLLDAFDHGAEVLLFAKDEDSKFFNSIIAEVENEIGRPIELALMPLSELNAVEA